MLLIDDFFKDIDGRWGQAPDAKIRLRIIGSAALMLQADYERGTKDDAPRGRVSASSDRCPAMTGQPPVIFRKKPAAPVSSGWALTKRRIRAM